MVSRIEGFAHGDGGVEGQTVGFGGIVKLADCDAVDQVGLVAVRHRAGDDVADFGQRTPQQRPAGEQQIEMALE